MSLQSLESDFRYYNGLLDPWVTMGYDGIACNLTQDFTSLFFTDYKPCLSSNEFHLEALQSLRRLTERYGTLSVLDNQGTQAQYLLALCRKNNIKVKILPVPEIPQETVNRVLQQLAPYQLSDEWSISCAALAEQSTSPLLIPHLEIRILNAHFSRKNNAVYDFNYFVHIFNERFYLLMKYFADHKKVVFSQFLLSTPSLFRSFFLASQNQEWLGGKASPTPHNYESEISLLRSFDSSIEKTIGLRLKISVQAPTGTKTFQQSSAPLHRLYREIFNISPEFNQKTEGLYGMVD